MSMLPRRKSEKEIKYEKLRAASENQIFSNLREAVEKNKELEKELDLVNIKLKEMGSRPTWEQIESIKEEQIKLVGNWPQASAIINISFSAIKPLWDLDKKDET